MTVETPTDLNVNQGETYVLQVAWLDSSVTPNVPISLTGYRAHMQIRLKAGAPGAALLDLVSPVDITLEPGGQTGVLTVRIPATETATLLKNCAYDLFLISTTDPTQATRLLYGHILLSRSVTVN
jgi:hypothetical protein